MEKLALQNQRETKHQHTLLFRWISLLLLFASTASCLEETQQEIFLSPRHFNPHPYVASFETRGSSPAGNDRVGPVVFPPSPPEEDAPVNTKIVTLMARDRKLNHPVDDHPYAKVAQKHQQKFASRFQDNGVNPRVYEALSSHAAKVLSEPASQLAKDYTLSSLSDEKKDYAFSYKVVDHLTGDDFSHSQSQNGPATNGEYRVRLPDGRVQIVSYIADKNGYKADVKYTENELPSQNIQIQRVPLPDRNPIRAIPILKANSYADYPDQYDITGGSNSPPALLYAHQKDYDDDGYITASPFAHRVSGQQGPIHHHQLHRQPNVQIFTSSNSNQINRGGGVDYVATTAAPFFFQQNNNVVSSTISPSEDYSYVNSNRFGIVQNQHAGELVYGK